MSFVMAAPEFMTAAATGPVVWAVPVDRVATAAPQG